MDAGIAFLIGGGLLVAPFVYHWLRRAGRRHVEANLSVLEINEFGDLIEGSDSIEKVQRHHKYSDDDEG